MSEELDDHWVKDILASLEPTERRLALRDIGRYLKRANVQRMTRQIDPEGQKWTPRKNGERRKMMVKLKATNRLKLKVSADELTLGWQGASGRIARVHHYGLRDRVHKRGVRVKYEQRKVLGLSQTDEDALTDIINNMLGN